MESPWGRMKKAAEKVKIEKEREEVRDPVYFEKISLLF